MDSSTNIPFQDISNTASPPPKINDVFKRLSVSPNRNHRLLEKPPIRLSPQQRIMTPKRLPSPDILRPTQSLDRYDRQKATVVKINEVTFPNSPTKTSNLLSNQPPVGGDGSLSRIRNRFRPNVMSPIKINLLDKLTKEEVEPSQDKEKKITNINSNSNSTRYKIGKDQRRTRSKSVKFQLPEDRAISLELKEIKKTNSMLLLRIEELENKISKLESKLP